MPRPDLAAIGVQHRRIPVLAIGRDVYLDSRLILDKLEALRPSVPRLGAPSPQDRGVQRLLASLTLDTGIFLAAMSRLPQSLPLLRDPAFLKDRASFVGDKGAWLSPADAVSRIREAMELLETTLLADGRNWILQTDKPSLADIEAIWPFHWLITLPGPESALPKDRVSEAIFPKVYAWINRFEEVVRAAQKAAPKPVTLKGPEAAELVRSSDYNDDLSVAGIIGTEDGLAKGSPVRLWPTDTGSAHRDAGRLVAVDEAEIVIEKPDHGGVRVHAPRHGFKVRADGGL